MGKDKPFLVRKRTPREGTEQEVFRKYAAIDIGSNGVRLLLSKVIMRGAYCTFTKESLVRMPIRLGADVFSKAKISKAREEQLVETMKAFSHLLKAYEPLAYRACATSAMREALNGERIAKRIRAEAEIDIDIIDGGQEAEMIFASHVADTLDPRKGYLYIDVGGGSTELTLFAKGKRIASRSFYIGTVRLLQGKVTKSKWREMREWVKANRPKGLPLEGIGSGGNMNKLFRLAGKTNDRPVTYSKLKEIDELLQSYTYEERVRLLHLRPDRADVIIPASKIFTSLMKWAEMKKLHVPQFGLADGLIHMLHDENSQIPVPQQRIGS